MCSIYQNTKEHEPCCMCGGTKNLNRFNQRENQTSVVICDSCLSMMYSMITERMLRFGDIPGGKTFRKCAGEISRNNSAVLERLERQASATNPKEICRCLDKYVVGQGEAKKVLSIALYTHMQRINSEEPEKIGKSNVMLVGPTGSGKTLLSKALSETAGVPFISVDATALTQAGYVGRDVEDILAQLLRSADGDIDRAQKGIVYIDEIDKIRKTNDSRHAEVNGEAVQQALLKMTEGAEVSVPLDGKHRVTMRTDNILFICGGAFEGMGKNSGSRSIGFTDSPCIRSENRKPVLEDFGMIPEFLGRFPAKAFLDALTEDDLMHALTEPKNSVLQQYSALFWREGIQLRISDDVLRAIARKASEKGTGARALRSVMDQTLQEALFGLPYDGNVNTCEITLDTLKTGQPKIYYAPGTDFPDEGQNRIAC